MKEQFRSIKFQKKNLNLLEKIKQILKEYDEKGIKVTLRQLYYQLVARGLISNNIKDYAKLSGLLTNARYTGLIDWEAIEDRTRTPSLPSTFADTEHLIDVACRSYQLDRWKEQNHYIELWTEKDAISSVIAPITEKYQVAMCVNRGYSSASAMYDSFKRLRNPNKKNIILYLGDYDASGLDMIRDIKERLEEFGVDDLEVLPIALTKEQIEKYSPPPNPAKITDPRAKWYIEKYGNQSWEVDALRPEVLQELIENSILEYLDLEKFQQVQEQEQDDIEKLKEENLFKNGKKETN